jgi:hypothetical protein
VGTGTRIARDGGGGGEASGAAEETDAGECAVAEDGGAAGLGGATAGLGAAVMGLGAAAELRATAGLGGAMVELCAMAGLGGGAAEEGDEVDAAVGDGGAVCGVVGVGMVSW